MPLRSADENTFQCVRCDSTLPTSWQLAKHLREVHRSPALRCSIAGCVALFTVQGSLTTHEKFDHIPCSINGCTWTGPSQDRGDHQYQHPSQSSLLKTCSNGGCFMRHDKKTKPSRMLHQPCDSPSCLVSLMAKPLAIHKNIGPHLTRKEEVEKYRQLVIRMSNGTGTLAGNGAGHLVREEFLKWKRSAFPNDVLIAYQNLHNLLQSHRERCIAFAKANGLGGYSLLVKLLLIPTPDSCFLATDCDLETSKTTSQDLNPFFSLPLNASAGDFVNIAGYLGTDTLQLPLAELDRIVERVRLLTGLSRSTFRQVLQRQDDQCLVRHLTAYLLCSKLPRFSRLYDTLRLYVQTSEYYRIASSEDGTIDQKPKAFAKVKESTNEQGVKVRALLEVLGLTPSELGFLQMTPSPPRSDSDGEPISRLGGFTILTTYGIRYSSQGGKIPWSSPYAEATQYNGIPKWYLLSEGLDTVLGLKRREALFLNNEDSIRLVKFTKETMEVMGLGGLPELALLAAAEKQDGVETGYLRLASAVYGRMYLPLVEASRLDPSASVIPPTSAQFSPNWGRAIVKACENEMGLTDLRLHNSHSWWRPTDIFLMEYVWLLFGSFDGLADLLRAILPGKTYSAMDHFLRENANHFRRQSRTPQALKAHIDKYGLQASYDQLRADPALVSRILECDEVEEEGQDEQDEDMDI